MLRRANVIHPRPLTGRNYLGGAAIAFLYSQPPALPAVLLFILTPGPAVVLGIAVFRATANIRHFASKQSGEEQRLFPAAC